MRESFFTSDVSAVVQALRESSEQPETHADQLRDILSLIESKLNRLLDDDRSPEREWRRSVAEPLHTLANVMRVTGKPLPSVEALATELSH